MHFDESALKDFKLEKKKARENATGQKTKYTKLAEAEEEEENSQNLEISNDNENQSLEALSEERLVKWEFICLTSIILLIVFLLANVALQKLNDPAFQNANVPILGRKSRSELSAVFETKAPIYQSQQEPEERQNEQENNEDSKAIDNHDVLRSK